MKKIEIKGLVHRNKKWIEIDGETYVISETKNKKKSRDGESSIILEKFPMREYEKAIEEIAEKVSKKANVKEIIKQSLYDVPLREILLMQKELEKEKPYVRNNIGCVSMSIGKNLIHIRD